MTTATLDRMKVEQFAGKMVDILNKGAMALMVSIGHRTGLFDTMSGMPPSTSAEIAAAAGLTERYVREWLGAMTVGGIVTCDEVGRRFTLPPEHAVSLTRAHKADNIAVYAQYIAILGGVEDKIVDCFKHGGGVPYSSFTRFHEVMAEDSGQTVMSSLIDHILPLVPGLTAALEQGIRVLDIGCGRGLALLLLAETYPRSRFTGYDLSEEATATAAADARARGLENVRFEARDLTDFHEWAPEAQYDLITAFDAIHDQARPDHVLAGINRALRPEGTFLMQDIAGSCHVHKNFEHPIGSLIYTISCMHCMTVSLAQGGMGLGAMWGEEKAVEMLQEAGFRNVKVNRLDHDFQNAYYVVTKT